MLTIPQVRDEMLKAAAEIDAGRPVTSDQLREWVKQMHRRPSIRKAPAIHKNPDRPTKKMIRDYREAHPEMTYFEISEKFSVGIGRVSEACRGKREDAQD